MLGVGVGVSGARPRGAAVGIAWTDLKATALDSGVSPWGFDATGLSASAAVTRVTDAPTYDGTSYLRCAISGADSGNAFARGQFTIALGEGDIFRSRCALFLPAGWNAAVVGSAQTARHDPFPTLNSHSGLLYDKAANNWRLFLKDNGVDSDLTERFAISEGAWHLLEVQTLLSTTSGWATVHLDGVLVGSGSGLKTLYAADPNVTRFRYGLVAIGSALQGALSMNIDAVDLDIAA